MASDSTPPATPKPTTGVGSLSIREGEMLAKAWSCLKSGPPEIDFPKLAAEMGMHNHRSAMNLWGVIKKKMQWGATTSSSTDTPGSAASKATGTAASGKRKKPVDKEVQDDSENNDDGDGAGQEEATPSKKAKTTPRAAKTPQKKQTARKTKAAASAKTAVVKAKHSDSDMKEAGEDSDGEAPADKKKKPTVAANKLKSEVDEDTEERSGDVDDGKLVKAEAEAKDESLDAV